MKYKESWYLALLAFCIAFFVHFIDYKWSDRSTFMHETADDPSYLRPAENWINTGTWKDNTVGPSSYVQRPPLLGVIHGVFYLISSNYSGIFLFLFALVLHALATKTLFELLKRETSIRIARIFTWLFITLPCFYGFLSYSISEVLVVSSCVFGISIYFSNSNKKVWMALSFLGLMYLLRPVLLLLFPFLLWAIWKERIQFKQHFKTAGICTIAILLCAIIWEFRKAQYTHEWLNPHPIYSAQNHTQFRPNHAELSQLFRFWETRPEVFHSYMGACWSGDSTAFEISKLSVYCAERNIPITPEKLQHILLVYSETSSTIQGSKNPEAYQKETTAELEFDKSIQALNSQIRSENRFQTWIQTPLQGIREQLPKSHLNLELFQGKLRGNLVIETLRYVCLSLVLLSFFAGLISIFVSDWNILFMGFGFFLYLYYLFFVQVMNEDRYLLPAFVSSFVLLALVCSKFYTRYFRKTA